MALVDLMRNPADDRQMNYWMLAHRDQHNRIRKRIRDLGGPPLADLQIESINFSDMQGWLANHQQMHQDMTGLAKVQSVDLETIDWKDQKQRAAWMELHFLEHQSVNAALGL